MNRRDYIRAARAVVGLDLTARYVLLLIATYSNDDGQAWPSADTLAVDANVHPGTVRRAISRARAAGLIVTHRPGLPSAFDLTGLAATPRAQVRDLPRALATPTPRARNGERAHASAQNRRGSLKYVEASAPRAEPVAELGPIELTNLAPVLLDRLMRLGQTMAGQQHLDLDD